jgi:hypothetical protein
MNNNTRPISPKPVLEDTSYPKVTGKIIKRFDLPIAKLVYDSNSKIKYSYCLNAYNSDEKLDDFLSVDKIIYTLISSVNYVSNDVHNINITTLLLSRKARELKYVSSISIHSSDGSKASKIFKMKDGTEAVLFLNKDRKNIASQIVLVNHSSFVTISSDLDSDVLIDIVTNYFVFEN